MLSKSKYPEADIDYFFAQLTVDKQIVDYKPTCGNILAGVGPAAIEMASAPETVLRIHAVNTGALVEAVLQTPGGRLRYDGTTEIAGVPRSAAPIRLSFKEVIGSVTGALLPTGRPRDLIDGIEVTCMDLATPIVMAKASAFRLTGYETVAALDENWAFYARMEPIRIEAGQRMVMGDVSQSMPPLCDPRRTTEGRLHHGPLFHALCLSPPAPSPRTLTVRPNENPAIVTIEHASGQIDITIDAETGSKEFTPASSAPQG